MRLLATLPIGTVFKDRNGTFYHLSHEAKLTYHWGTKGHCGMNPIPKYVVPIKRGNVCIYIDPEQIVKGSG